MSAVAVAQSDLSTKLVNTSAIPLRCSPPSPNILAASAVHYLSVPWIQGRRMAGPNPPRRSLLQQEMAYATFVQWWYLDFVC